jgi:SRSO17 transposase
MLTALHRKNCWTLAGYAGERDPNGMQRLLNSAQWDVDGVRDDLRDWVVERLADPALGVLVPIELFFPKRGAGSAGVQRRYNAAAGKVENVQIGIFLAYVSARGHALVDRELYLPESWTVDRDRCDRAGVPASVRFATEPQLIGRMIENALDSHVPAAWVAADRVYGRSRALRVWLEHRSLAYMLGIRGDDRLVAENGQVHQAHERTASLPESEWRRVSWDGSRATEPGSEWARVKLADQDRRNGDTWQHSLLAYRSPTRAPGHFLCYGPADSPIQELVRVADCCSTVEEYSAWARSDLGLGDYQVRRYDAWYRHVTLCLVANAYAAVCGGARGDLAAGSDGAAD